MCSPISVEHKRVRSPQVFALKTPKCFRQAKLNLCNLVATSQVKNAPEGAARLRASKTFMKCLEQGTERLNRVAPAIEIQCGQLVSAATFS